MLLVYNYGYYKHKHRKEDIRMVSKGEEGKNMDVADAFKVMEEYDLLKEAKLECKRKKLDEAPYDMKGHYEIFGKFLDKKRKELYDISQKRQESMCVNDEAVKSQNCVHKDCFFNRLFFKSAGFCKECSLGKELDALETKMNTLSEASKALKEAADYDDMWR